MVQNRYHIATRSPSQLPCTSHSLVLMPVIVSDTTQPIPPSRNVSPHRIFGPLCENATLSTKPEVRNVLQCCQRRTELRPQTTCVENLVKLKGVVLEICVWSADRQTDRLIDTLVTILEWRIQRRMREYIPTGIRQFIAREKCHPSLAYLILYITICLANCFNRKRPAGDSLRGSPDPLAGFNGGGQSGVWLP